MKYYKNDIVEIITAKYKDYKDVPQHEIGYFENQGEPVPFIGQRFRVYDADDDSIYGSYINGKGDFDLCLVTQSNNLTLYKRPFINWMKLILGIKC